jgi:hypothetical protein
VLKESAIRDTVVASEPHVRARSGCTSAERGSQLCSVRAGVQANILEGRTEPILHFGSQIAGERLPCLLSGAGE